MRRFSARRSANRRWHKPSLPWSIIASTSKETMTRKKIPKRLSHSVKTNASGTTSRHRSTTNPNEPRSLLFSRRRVPLQVCTLCSLLSFLMNCYLDTYNIEELTRCSNWCLTYCSGPQRVFVALRDRSQLLLSSVMAFRGESSRIMLWSDLFMKVIPMPDAGDDVYVPVNSIEAIFFSLH
jgi:hypothetical protein